MVAAKTISRSEVDGNIAVLTLDMPGRGANVLSSSVLDELAAHLDAVESEQFAGLVLRSGKPGTFIAGADLREFAGSLDMPREQVVETCRRGQRLFHRLAKGPFITVAAIDGTCLGGGAELALWCDRRVVSTNERTEIGLPEVKLGLFPGWGATVRLPRMIGLGNAVELITGGNSINAQAAANLGLVDDVVPAERLLEAAIAMVRDQERTQQYLEDRRGWSQPLEMPENELGFLGATASAFIRQQTQGHYPAPLAALEQMLETADDDVDTACQHEAERMSKLFGTPINAALLNVFFLTDRNKRDSGGALTNDSPKLDALGIIGAGIMGSGIAALSVKRNLPVTILDAVPQALARGTRTVIEEVSYNKNTRQLDVQRSLQYVPLLNPASTDQELTQCDLVIEAIVETEDVKRKLFRRIEPLLKDGAILASNTSTIPISKLATELKHPENFCGIHFFNPVRSMKLVEVIRGEKTGDHAIAAAVHFARRIGKMPVVVNDGPGFLVNRLLMMYMQEAAELICDGASIPQVDQTAKSFGMPMGPITLYDLVGVDTAVFAGRTMWEAFPDRIIPSRLLRGMMKAGRLGQKTKLGFFAYSDKDKRAKGREDPTFAEFAAPFRHEPRSFEPEELTHRLFLPMLVEATRLIEQNQVRDCRDIDLGVIFGLGFPAFRGGLLYWADSLGAARVVELLKPFEALGPRMQPTELLLDMAKSGRRFYP